MALKAVADRKQVVEIGTYRDEQMVYEHADDPCEQEDSELEAITCKLQLLKTFIPDIEEYRPMHYTSAKTTYDANKHRTHALLFLDAARSYKTCRPLLGE